MWQNQPENKGWGSLVREKLCEMAKQQRGKWAQTSISKRSKVMCSTTGLRLRDHPAHPLLAPLTAAALVVSWQRNRWENATLWVEGGGGGEKCALNNLNFTLWHSVSLLLANTLMCRQSFLKVAGNNYSSVSLCRQQAFLLTPFTATQR